MYTVENDHLKVVITPKGAELESLFNKKTGIEYLWNADPKFWPKKSPLLFPVVGTLKKNKYYFEGKAYEISTRHGFARDTTFSVKAQSARSVTFNTEGNVDTLKIFPFNFSLSVIYTIEEDKLSVTYLVKNKGTGRMYFSVGGHPAFRLPMADGLTYDDYYLLFNKTENAGRWPIAPDGLIETNSVPLLDNTRQLNLSKSLFYKDAVILKKLASDEVQLKSDKHGAGLTFSFKGFPYLGIWAAKDADFICIEPWCGISDVADTNQQLTDKEGIVNLPGGENFERTWSVTTW